MKCFSCGAETTEGRQFCTACGAALPAICPACNGFNPAGAKFCADCGAPLGAVARTDPVRSEPKAKVTGSAPALPTAERRHVTVMFCDLVGSTALSARLDPEDLREVIGRYQASVTKTVGRFDGFVAKYMGDGVLVYFGYPHAHEDDPEQAVRAGLALLDAAGQLKAPEPLQVRIGIATGLVVVGDLIGAGSAQEQAIVGETPNLASRLQALAEPDAIVIAEGTRRQIGARFEVRDLGPQALKGFGEPQRAWRVLSENRVLGRFEALRSGATALVGRDEELDLLLRRWAQAKAGSGRVVLISAEPGVGKSRLAEALAERIAALPHVRLRYFCSPHHQDSALYPVIAQMERAARFAHEDLPGGKLAKLQALLSATAPPMDDVALLAELHSLPSADIAPPLDVTPQRRKEKTFEALLRQIERLSSQQPVLMVFEDIHWIDPSSRELLERTMQRIANWSVLLVATFRPEFQPPWTGQPHVTMLALTRLDRRDTAVMVANIAGNHALPAAIVQEIAERTDGVPLFVEELTKAVLESGAQVDAALSVVPHPAPSVPATLHASLMARLDRLGPVAKDIAQKGALIGREFGHELLASIADLPEPQLREALDRLTSSGLLFVHGTPPQSTYLFKHALVQDAAYGTLLRGRRQQLHARIASTLEGQFPEIVAMEPERLARHLTEADLPEKAIGYWLEAGQRAVARSAMTEALALLRSGLAVISILPDSTARQQNELDLQIAYRRALVLAKGFAAPEADQAFARARQLCEQLKRTTQLVAVIWHQFQIRSNRGEFRQLHQDAEEVSRLGAVANDKHLKWLGCFFCGSTCCNLGEFSDSRAYLELVAEDRSIHAALPAEVVDESIVLWLSRSLGCLGYLDQAQMRLDELRPDSPFARAVALMAAWLFAWSVRSDPRWMLQRADDLWGLADEQDFPLLRAVGFIYRGWCLAVLGHAEEGLALLATGSAEFRIQSVIATPALLTWLADAYGMAGQPQAGLERLAEALQLGGETGERWAEAETLRLRGQLLIAMSDPVAAEASFCEGLALARQQDAKLWELRTATSLAGLWRDQGKRIEARELLAPVYDWFTEGFGTSVLREAKALLMEL